MSAVTDGNAGNGAGAAAALDGHELEASPLSETRFLTLFERCPLSIQILSPDGRTLHVNRAFEELFGLSQESIRGYNLLQDPQIREAGMMPLLERGFRGETVTIPPIRFEPDRTLDVPGGPPRWLQGLVYPVNGDDGTPQEVILLHQDVTAQKQVEDELEARVAERTAELARANAALQAEIAERQRSDAELLRTASELQAIFRALPDRYFRLDPEGTILDYRTGNEADPLLALGTIIGKRVQDVLPPEVGRKMEVAVRQVATDGMSECLEFSLFDGEQQLEFEARLVRLRSLDGDQVITVVRDITDRVMAERALQRSEEHFRTIAENSSDVVTILNADGTIRYQSPATARVFGRPNTEMIGKWGFEFFHPEDIAPTAAKLSEVVKQPGKTMSAEFRLLHDQGHYIWCEAVGRTLLPHSPEGGVLINTRDVTARKKADEALLESEARSSAIVQYALDCIITINHEGKVVEFNPAAEATFGYTRAEALGRDLNQLIVPPAFREAHRRGITHFLETGEGPVLNRRIEVPALRKDGSEITIELAATAIPLSDSPIFTAYLRDVTQRRESEAALRESEERLRFALEAGGMGTFEWQIDTGKVSWSPTLEVIHGRKPGSFGGTFEEVLAEVHPEDRDRLTTSIMGAVAGLQNHDIEYRAIWPDGSTHWLGAKGRVARDETGRAIRMVGVCTDITARKEWESELRRAKDEAEAANVAKSEFLSRMSHELRTPMNSILGFAQVLARKSLPPDQMRSLDYILKAGRHLLDLINEVLDIARIEANRMQLSLEPVRVGTVLSEALNLIQPLAAQRGCRIDVDGAPEWDEYVRADRQRLIQVLLNLASNAVKYNRPQGSVYISCQRQVDADTDRLCVSIRDTGAGIPSDQIGRLFVPFERLGAAQSEIEGTGLGLALSQRLVEAMGGTLTVESVVGQGSTFSVVLERVESPLERLGRSESSGTEGAEVSTDEAQKRATLLYIEDNLANLSLIETILSERAEIRLLSALQGRLGLDLAWEHRPDLILLDLHLPDMHGEEVLRRLLDDPRSREIPVVVISADATPRSIERLLGAGARGYLTKPLDVEQFLKTVDQHVERE